MRLDQLIIMFYFYGLNEKWPGRTSQMSLPWQEKVRKLEEQTTQEIKQLVPEIDIQRRSIPYFSMHEFESLLFSKSSILSEKKLGSPKKL